MADRDLFDELGEQGLRPITEPWWTTTAVFKGPAFDIPFRKVTSARFEVKELSLEAYRAPLSEVLTRNSVKDLRAAEDARFLAAMDAAVGGLILKKRDQTFFGGPGKAPGA